MARAGLFTVTCVFSYLGECRAATLKSAKGKSECEPDGANPIARKLGREVRRKTQAAQWFSETTHGASDNMQKLNTMEDWLSTPGAIDAAIMAMIRRMIRNAERRQKTQSGKGKTRCKKRTSAENTGSTSIS